MKIKPTILCIAILIAMVSCETHEEWSARKDVESKNRAMFSGSPIAWKAKSVEAVALRKEAS